MSHLLRATGSENTAEWFEPGWNAPGFTKNGFDALRVDFTAITGPGKMYLLGNSPEADENAKLGTFLADDTYQVVKGASLPIKGHQHAHWFFTHAGKYTMSGVVVGAKTDGDKVSSQPFTMSWDVLKSDDDKRPDPSDDSGEPSAGPSHDRWRSRPVHPTTRQRRRLTTPRSRSPKAILTCLLVSLATAS